MSLLAVLISVLLGLGAAPESAVPTGSPAALPAAWPRAPFAALAQELEPRREAFEWLAPEDLEGGVEIFGFEVRDATRVAPGEWRLQSRMRWIGDGIELHCVERVGSSGPHRLVHRELRAPNGRTVLAIWPAAEGPEAIGVDLGVAHEVDQAVRLRTAGEGRPVERQFALDDQDPTSLGLPALVELLRLGLAPQRALVLDPLAGTFRDAELNTERPCRWLPGLRCVRLTARAEASAASEADPPLLELWWVFAGRQLLGHGGPAGSLRARRVDLDRLPEDLR